MNSLSSLIVTPEDIAGTYQPDGFTQAQQYRKAMGLSEKGITLDSIQKEMEIDKGTLSRWINEQAQPHSVKAITLLTEMGVFQCIRPDDSAREAFVQDSLKGFSWRSPAFQAMVLLSCNQTWHKSLVDKGDTHPSTLRVDDPDLRKMVETILGADADSRGGESAIARVLAQMQSETGFPKQVELAINTLSLSDTSEEEKTSARNILRTFVLSAFYANRAIKYATSDRQINLPSSADPQIAMTRRDIFVRCMQESGIPVPFRVSELIENTPNQGTKTLNQFRIYLPGHTDFDTKNLAYEFGGRMLGAIRSIEETRARG